MRTELSLLVCASLFLVVMSSGCTVFQGTTTAGNGVVISAFEADFSQLYSGEPVQLRLNIINAGTVDAQVNEIKLIGLDSDTGTSGWTQSQETCSSITGKLLPTDTSRGVSGEQRNCYWNLVAPAIDQGLSRTYNPTVRVTYDYSTSSIKSITVGSINEIRSLMDRGQTLTTDVVSSTSGPISISINAKGPIRISESGSVTIPIEIAISNVGGGVVCDSSCSSADNWNKMTIQLPTTEGISYDDCSDKQVTLWHGQSNTIGCRLVISSPPQSGTVQRTITVRSSYQYFTETSTSLFVTGTQQSY